MQYRRYFWTCSFRSMDSRIFSGPRCLVIIEWQMRRMFFPNFTLLKK
ncbi:hypothetical protein E1A91_A12G061300v1 [Gossypium mustelinum]|uniref:Uncharacterized protein n=1 Tax=Gossypium mustelinum TaxID=34275 RepID=A0A5D2WQA2_GOSMU|nr:hypothetical protein E1A91_A12G061300v1 [Gossypium mustelinum]